MNRRNINLDDFVKKDKLGKGSYGEVYKILKKSTKEVYAAKYLQLYESSKKSINREIQIMANLIHPTIAKLIGFNVTDIDHEQYQVTIVMEMAENGSLRSILKDCDNTKRQIILVGIARGMMFLHQNKVIHCDLKPDNILIDKDFKPHITDFGLSKFTKIISNLSDSLNFRGSPYYMAPEVIKDESNNVKSDVYSFSIIMFEVITGQKPYPEDINLYTLLNKVSEQNYRPTFPEDFKNESLKKLIYQCWDKNPENRPTFEDIFNKLAYNHNKNYDLFESNQCYYLDNVDIKKVHKYAHEINYYDESQLNNEIVLVHERLEQIEKILIYYLSNEKSRDDILNFIKMIEDIFSSPSDFYDLSSKLNNLRKDIDDLRHKFNDLKLHKIIKVFQTFILKTKEKLTELENKQEQYKGKNNQLFTKIIEKNHSFEGMFSDIQSRFEHLEKKLEKNNQNDTIQKMFKIFDKKLEINKKEIEEKFQNEIKEFKNENLKIKNQLTFFWSQMKLTDATIDYFNSIPVSLQSLFISTIINEKSGQKINQNFIYLNEILQQLNKFDQISNIGNCISIKTKNNKQLLLNFYDSNIKIDLIELKQVEYLYKNKLFDSKEFIKSLLNLDNISIQIKYPSESFSKIYSIVSSIKNNYPSKKVNICVLLTQYPKNNQDYDLNKFDIDLIELNPLITNIHTKSFSKMNSLKEILIPSSVNKIESEAFSECSSLKKIPIPNSVKKIENGSFKGCSSLEEISIPSSIKVIENDTFSNCAKLKQVSIPVSVSKIEDKAFFGCSSLNKLKIPDSVTSIGNSSFSKCSSLYKISLQSVNSIGDFAFSDCIALKKIKFTKNLKSIGKSAFSGCESLKYLFIPFSVGEIGNNAFNQCSSLELISLPISAYSKKLNINKNAQITYTNDSSDSYYQFGDILFRGDNVTMDRKLAIKYYKMAIDGGNVKAMLKYGNVLFTGEGIEINKKEAIKYIKMAADKGNEQAMFQYGSILFTGDGITINKKLAIKYFKMAINGGSEQAMLKYGNVLFTGDGIEMDKKEAIKYIKMAADKGNEQAMLQYGNILLTGNGIKIDKKLAIKYIKMAADKGNEQAMFQYGNLLFTGDGIEIDKKLAIKYYAKFLKI